MDAIKNFFGFGPKPDETNQTMSGTAPVEALGPDGVQGGRRRRGKKTRKGRKGSKRARTGRRSTRL